MVGRPIAKTLNASASSQTTPGGSTRKIGSLRFLELLLFHRSFFYKTTWSMKVLGPKKNPWDPNDFQAKLPDFGSQEPSTSIASQRRPGSPNWEVISTENFPWETITSIPPFLGKPENPLIQKVRENGGDMLLARVWCSWIGVFVFFFQI